ncbi:MAG: hypothetical protein KTR31_17795, partial [Myxococcales bacterium]|nr:hypothetical protein [Myxococcales bacterium]
MLGWAAITVRIAWTLRRLGVRVRTEVLQDARTHVLYHLDPATSLPVAEDLAEHLTEEFVARAFGKAPEDPWPADWEMPLSGRWRRAIEQTMDALAESVLHRHYGDHRSLDHLASTLGHDRLDLQRVRAGLRSVVVRVGSRDGLPMGRWPEERVDRLLRRLAAWAPGPCPRVLDVVEGCHRTHVQQCPRCDRLARLVQSQVLDVDALLPPTLGARPQSQASVIALQIRDDGLRHRRLLVAELQPAMCFPVGDDMLLVDGDHIDAVSEALWTAAEVGAPERSTVRGALIRGPGTWSDHGLLGRL